jgi:hypothetical protein
MGDGAMRFETNRSSASFAFYFVKIFRLRERPKKCGWLSEPAWMNGDSSSNPSRLGELAPPSRTLPGQSWGDGMPCRNRGIFNNPLR